MFNRIDNATQIYLRLHLRSTNKTILQIFVHVSIALRVNKNIILLYLLTRNVIKIERPREIASLLYHK